MPKIAFTVDSALLRELGERLVGRPAIALAELVKNSYDADATDVTIRFDENRLEVWDNGHGMDFEAFRDYWMRIGSPHKETQGTSRRFGRPLTGSKGVGRLSVQFLARQLELRTRTRGMQSELVARVDWDAAVSSKELTKATATWRRAQRNTTFPGRSSTGTAIILSDLNQDWTSEEFEDLARELWPLQPPFKTPRSRKARKTATFSVELEHPNVLAMASFQRIMGIVLTLWHARLVGKLVRNPSEKPKLQLTVRFADNSSKSVSYSIDGDYLHELEFEIRVFHLKYRQPHGIRVEEARKYLNQYGGVHIYDGGFHLPYYGSETDWLRIEIDHSHRLSSSRLLPDELQVPGGMSFLPTNSRLFGVVNVNSGVERRKAVGARPRERLQIQVSRDRLVDNRAFRQLRDYVRYALDFYAVTEAARSFEATTVAPSTGEPPVQKARRVELVLERYKHEMSSRAYSALVGEIADVVDSTQTEADRLQAHASLLGTLATAGISTLAYEHELGKQLRLFDHLVIELARLSSTKPMNPGALQDVAARLKAWGQRARATRALFSHLLDEKSRGMRSSFKAKRLLTDVIGQVDLFLRKVEVEILIPADVRLPEGSYAEWASIFQNVLLNAVNAMIDSPTRRIQIDVLRGRRSQVRVQDTGVGVDLEDAEKLFQPFERRLGISPGRASLGLGGTGLGLTIVRMISTNLRCEVGFDPPDEGFNTCFFVGWTST